MKKFLSVLFITMSLVAVTNQEQFLQAEQAYNNGHIAAALDLYTALADKNPAVWYNIGCCNYEQSDKLNALLAWRKAYRYAATYALQEEAKGQIERTERMLGIQQPASWVDRVAFHLSAYTAPMGTLIMQLLCLLLVWSGLLFALLLYRRGYRLITLLLCGVLIGLVLCGFLLVRVANQPQVMAPDYVVLRVGPDSWYHIHDQLMPGTVVRVSEQQKEWYYIRQGKHHGWLRAADLVVIE